MKNVVVFFGGRSCEREISIITGVFVLNCIDKSKYNPIPVFIDGDGRFFSGEKLFNLDFYRYLDRSLLNECVFLAGDCNLYYKKRNKLKSKGEIYAGINCMHGKNGEDGSLTGYVQTCGLAFLSAGTFAESVSIDKDFTKLLLNSLDIKSVDYVRLKRDYFFERSELAIKYVGEKLGYPVIVKPSRLGSSIGIEKATDAESLFLVLSRAFRYDDKVICEQYLSGATDLNCAVYCVGKKIYHSRVEKATTINDILTFEDKYGGGKLGNQTSRDNETNLSGEIQNKVQSACEKIYRRCDFNSIVRFDFLLCDNQLFLNEINAVPGSLAYYLFCNKISEFTLLLNDLIADCAEKFRKQKNLISNFQSNVLNGDWSGIKK